MKPVKILTRIENGKLKRNVKILRSALESFEGKEIEITIKRKYKSRSLPQNRTYWGIYIPQFQEMIKEHWGEILSIEETHEILKFHCNYNERVNEDTGEIIRTPKSTTELTTVGFMEFQQKLAQLAIEFFNTVLQEPNEQLSIFK